MSQTMKFRRRNVTILCCSVFLLLMVWVFDADKSHLDHSELANFFSTETDQFINRHNFTFTLSSNVCSKDKYHIVVLVHSGPSYLHRRKLIRETYGGVKKYLGKVLTVVFLLGAVESAAVQKKVMKESQERGDIIQGNFLDSYKNLSIKHIMAMHWFQNNCQADFVMKLDDDTFVNPYRLVEFIGTLNESDSDVIYCKVMSNEKPVRESQSKWLTPFQQYPFDYFPPFCLGFAYITTPKAWRTLYTLSSYHRKMDMDDVYVTGILASVGGIQRKDMSEVMYDCRAYWFWFDMEAFSNAVLVLDRWNRCKDEPFDKWGYLSE